MEAMFIFGSLGFCLFVGSFLVILLLEAYVNQQGGTMEERKATVFEVYRYTVCFVMMLFFGIASFILLNTMVNDMEHLSNAAGPGVATVLVAVIFIAHWMMPNPAAPRITEAKSE